VFVISDAALHSGNTVYTVDADNILQQHSVEIVWRDGENTVVNGSLKEGDQLVISPVSASLNGSRVEITEVTH